MIDAKIDPIVEKNLPIFKIGGWNNLQPSHQNLFE